MALKLKTVELTPIAPTGCRIENLCPEELGQEGVFHCEAYDAELICGYFVPYHDFLADRSYLPLATSALVVCKGELLIGQRSKSMQSFPAHFELIPSGGIHQSTDKTEELLNQCAGDAGIDASCVREITPLALIEDLKERSLDICMLVELSERPELSMKSEEYTGVRWVSPTEFKLLMEAAPVVPTSAALFEYWNDHYDA